MTKKIRQIQEARNSIEEYVRGNWAAPTVFFNKYHRISYKTNLLELVASSIKSAQGIRVVELGAMRSLGKLTLFYDGWSTLAFLLSKAVVNQLISVDLSHLSMLEGVRNYAAHLSRKGWEDADEPLDSVYLQFEAPMQEFVATNEFQFSKVDLLYCDGPDDVRVTNDALGYCLNGNCCRILFDDYHTKVSKEAREFLERTYPHLHYTGRGERVSLSACMTTETRSECNLKPGKLGTAGIGLDFAYFFVSKELSTTAIAREAAIIEKGLSAYHAALRRKGGVIQVPAGDIFV